MQRFYVTFPLEESLVIDDEKLYHQMARVLRMQKGDKVGFFCGEWVDHIYAVSSIDKKHVFLEKAGKILKKPSTAPKIHLLQALPNKLEKLEFILQKGVEAGIDSFTFFPSDRSQPLPILERKKERLVEIAREALEQCGGDVMPEIRFEKSIPEKSDMVRLVTDTLDGYVPVREVGKHDAYELCVWPEGGWSDAERESFKSEWVVFISLGDRIFRTETAPIVGAFFLRNR